MDKYKDGDDVIGINHSDLEQKINCHNSYPIIQPTTRKSMIRSREDAASDI